MTRLKSLLVAALLAVLVWPGAGRPEAARAPCTVMLDQSLSMMGFYDAQGERITRLVDAMAGLCGEAMVVGAGARFETGRLGTLRPQGAFGFDTYLGEGLETWLQRSASRRLVLITDNVADRGGSSTGEGEQERFYRLLNAPASELTHISMLIVRLPFNGPVYALNSRASNRYSGPRALTIYVLERRGTRGDDAFLGQVEAAAQGLQFARYGGRGAPGPNDYAVARLSPFRPGIEADTAGVSVEPAQGGRNVSFADGVISVSRGASDSETRFALREVRVDTGPDWDFGNAPFRAGVRFPRSPVFGPALDGRCEVEPPRSSPGLNRRVTLSLQCTIPPATANLSEEERDRLAMQGPVVREGQLFLAMETRGRDLSLRGPLQRYFGMSAEAERNPQGLASPTADVQERVYRLPELLTSAIPTTDRTVIIKRFGLRVEMGSSGLRLIGNWLLSALPYLLGLLALGAIAWFATRPVTYKVSGAAGLDKLQLQFARGRDLRALDGTKVRLTLLGPALLATAGTERRLAGRSGGAIKDAAGKVAVTLTRVAAVPARPGAGTGRGGRPPRRPVRR